MSPAGMVPSAGPCPLGGPSASRFPCNQPSCAGFPDDPKSHAGIGSNQLSGIFPWLAMPGFRLAFGAWQSYYNRGHVPTIRPSPGARPRFEYPSSRPRAGGGKGLRRPSPESRSPSLKNSTRHVPAGERGLIMFCDHFYTPGPYEDMPSLKKGRKTATDPAWANKSQQVMSRGELVWITVGTASVRTRSCHGDHRLRHRQAPRRRLRPRSPAKTRRLRTHENLIHLSWRQSTTRPVPAWKIRSPLAAHSPRANRDHAFPLPKLLPPTPTSTRLVALRACE